MVNTGFAFFDYYCPFDHKCPNFSCPDIYLSPDMKKAVRAINKFFITIVLVLFYVVVIGFTSVFLRVSRLLARRKKSLSYWEKGLGDKIRRDYFKSAY